MGLARLTVGTGFRAFGFFLMQKSTRHAIEMKMKYCVKEMLCKKKGDSHIWLSWRACSIAGSWMTAGWLAEERNPRRHIILE